MQIRKMGAVLASAAVVAGGSLGVAQAQSNGSNDGGGSNGSGQARGPRGGPFSAAQLKALAGKLGVSTAQLKAAFEATKPSKPANGERRGGPGAGFAADIASALGVKTADVQEILDANRPAKPDDRPARGTAPAKPDHTKLIAALASGLGIDKADVQAAFDKLDAAHRAEGDARRDAHAAALAKELGLDADAVASALESVGPPAHAGPGGPRR